MIQKKYFILGAVVLVLIFVVCLALFLSARNKDNEYIVKEIPPDVTTSKDNVTLDVSAYPNILSESDKQSIIKSVVKQTTYDTKGIKSITAVVRKGSYIADSNGKSLIVDVAKLQTSYFIDIYDDPKDDIRILNVLCVPKEQQIYSKDYCYEA